MDCKAMAVYTNGKGKVKKFGKFTCYAAKIEAMYKESYKAHKSNTIQSKRDDFVPNAIKEIKKRKFQIVRIHSAGDFYDLEYTTKWIEIAKALPHVQFFGYTKVLESWNLIRDAKLSNMSFVFSLGSLDDVNLTGDEFTCKVVIPGDDFTGILACNGKTDKDKASDYFYILGGVSFGLGLH